MADDDDEPKFHFKAKAGLFTWNGEFVEADFDLLWAKFETFEPKPPCRMSMAMELNKRGKIHFHAMLEWKKQQDRFAGFEFKGAVPNIKPNSGRNIERGHYYCQAPKIGVLQQKRTDEERVIAKQGWIKAFWTQSKMTRENLIAEAILFKCWTRNLKGDVECHRDTKRQRKEEREIAEIPFDEELMPCVTLPEWETYAADFKKALRRYKIFILVGPTKVGKSTWARSVTKNPFVMSKSECWTGYSWKDNDAVIFEDFSHPWRYILENRNLLQGSKEGAMVGLSATNCFARKVVLFQRPKIFLMNYDVFNAEVVPDWVNDNSVIVHRDTPLFQTGGPPELPVSYNTNTGVPGDHASLPGDHARQM